MRNETVPSPHLGSFAVYHTATGQLIHLLTVECMPGSATPSAEEINREAILSAAHTSGVDPASLAVLPLGHAVLKPTSSYRVDPATQTLEEQPRS